MNPSSVGKSTSHSHPPLQLAGYLAFLVAFPLLAEASPLNPHAGTNPVKTLLLVREWDSAHKRLVGWLPNHQITMELESLDLNWSPQFKVNDAVKLGWPRHYERPEDTGMLSISPASRNFDGEAWIPVRKASNLVVISKHYFLIRKIIFGEAQPALRLPETSSMSFVHAQPNG